MDGGMRGDAHAAGVDIPGGHGGDNGGAGAGRAAVPHGISLSSEIQTLKVAYHTTYNRDLSSVIRSELSAKTKRLLT